MTGEGEYPRGQEVVKYMKIRGDVSGAISTPAEHGVHRAGEKLDILI